MSTVDNLNHYGARLLSTYQDVKENATKTKLAEIIGSVLVACCVVNFFYSLDRVDLSEMVLSGVAGITLFQARNIVCYSRKYQENIAQFGITGRQLKNDLSTMTQENVNQYLGSLESKRQVILGWKLAADTTLQYMRDSVNALKWKESSKTAPKMNGLFTEKRESIAQIYEKSTRTLGALECEYNPKK